MKNFTDDNSIANVYFQSRKPAEVVAEHSETDMSNPEEKREVQIGKDVLRKIKQIHRFKGQTFHGDWTQLKEIAKLMRELITMHGQKAPKEVEPGPSEPEPIETKTEE